MVLLCGLASPAQAEEVSSAQLRALAERAAQDPAARERLLTVDRVDGRPVAVGAALRDARGEALAERARVLAEGLVRGEDSSAQAQASPRGRAREVLRERRFRGSKVPRPFEGIARWLGERVRPVTDPLSRLGDRVPGGSPLLYGLLALLVLAAAVGVTRATIRRRARAAERAADRVRAAGPADPRVLEREAERAERDGDWEAAVRLRFRAGLLRLAARHAIDYRPSLTTGDVAAAVPSPAFAALGTYFDAIAYGGRIAEPADALASREGWERVLTEVGGR